MQTTRRRKRTELSNTNTQYFLKELKNYYAEQWGGIKFNKQIIFAASIFHLIVINPSKSSTMNIININGNYRKSHYAKMYMELLVKFISQNMFIMQTHLNIIESIPRNLIPLNVINRERKKKEKEFAGNVGKNIFSLVETKPNTDMDLLFILCSIILIHIFLLCRQILIEEKAKK